MKIGTKESLSLIQVSYESDSSNKELAEIMAASTVLDEAGIDAFSIKDIKGGF